MKETSKIFLDKLFNENEEVCLSPTKYAYASFPVKDIGPEMLIQSQNKDRDWVTMAEESVNLIAMNPIKGDRNDLNVTAYRTFLVEIDDGEVYEQKQYIDSLNMPYTVCVFSGNKSLHYGITLSEDLPTEQMWRDINEWILAVVEKADQQTKNPSRSIRFPGNKRHDGKQLVQQLVDVRERVDLDVLLDWLSQWADRNPRLKKSRERRSSLGPIEIGGIPKWMSEKLIDGIGRHGSRNAEWFQMSMELAKRGHNEDSIILALGPHFTPEHDFTLREWNTVIKSAVKRAERGYHE